MTAGSNVDVAKIVTLTLNRGEGTITGDGKKSLEIKVRSTGITDIKFNLEVGVDDIVSSETLATKIKGALDANDEVMNLFTITQDLDKIIMESKAPGDDKNMGLLVSNVNYEDAIVKGTQISQETRKGSKITKEKLIVKATPANNSGEIKFSVLEGETQVVEVPVTVATGDTSLQVGEKVIAVLNANDTFKGKYSATMGKNGQWGSADFIIIEQLEGKELNVGLSVKISE